MSSDKKDSSDLTRIEDLSDFIHAEEDEDISLELDDFSSEESPKSDETNFLEMEKDSFGDATSFMQIPDELNDTTTEDFKEDDSLTENFDDSNFETSDFDAGSNDFQSNDFEEENSFEDESFESDNTETDFNADFSLEETTPTELDSDDFAQEIEEEEVTVQEPIQDIVESIAKEAPAPIPAYKAPETMDDVQAFGQDIVAPDFSIEGNPPFSIVIKNLKYLEDAEDIIQILTEYKVIKPEHLEDTNQALHRGQLLIPRLGEYSAIMLCHKLRKFDIDITMGLTHEIHSPSSYESRDNGLTSRLSIHANKSQYHKFNKDELSTEDVQVTNLSSFENYSIVKSLSIKTRSISIETESLSSSDFDQVYSQAIVDLTHRLQQDAIDIDANALINFNTTVLVNPADNSLTNIMSTANIVRVIAK